MDLKTTLMAAAAACFIAAGGSAFAGPKGKECPKAKAAKAAALVKQFDKDGDGKLNAAEQAEADKACESKKCDKAGKKECPSKKKGGDGPT
jgi:hypothetical protein